MHKKLYRSKTDQNIAGVCAGLAEYLNIDPTVIRVVWALVGLCAGTGVLAYIVCALVIPEKPDQIDRNNIIDAE
jgi:phage shock protein C